MDLILYNLRIMNDKSEEQSNKLINVLREQSRIFLQQSRILQQLSEKADRFILQGKSQEKLEEKSDESINSMISLPSTESSVYSPTDNSDREELATKVVVEDATKKYDPLPLISFDPCIKDDSTMDMQCVAEVLKVQQSSNNS